MGDWTKRWYQKLSTIVEANKECTQVQLRDWQSRDIWKSVKNQVQGTFTTKKAAATVAVLFMSSVGAYSVHSSVQHSHLIYKVYIDGSYIGSVADATLVRDKITELGSHLQSTVSIVPVYESNVKETLDGLVLTVLKDAADDRVAAVKIAVDGNDVAVVKDQQTAAEVIDSILKKSLSLNPSDQVQIKQKIEFVPTKVKSDQILTADGALHVLERTAEKPEKYLVSRGESLWAIADRHGMSVEKLIASNPQIKDGNSLKEGEEIALSSIEPIVTVEAVEEITRTVKIDYDIQYKDDSSMPKGQTRVIQDGSEGEKTQQVRVYKANGKVTDEEVLSEKVTTEKVDKIVARGTKIIPGVANGDWIRPVNFYAVTSAFGEWRGGSGHKGIDLGAPTGAAIYASNSGRVIEAGWDNGGYGNCVRIDHGNGVVTIYGHMSAINVSVGENVEKGSVIGAVGATGNATGPHLHYEVHVNGVVVNPRNYM